MNEIWCDQCLSWVDEFLLAPPNIVCAKCENVLVRATDSDDIAKTTRRQLAKAIWGLP